MAASMHHQIVIIGGGAAGITVAAELRRHDHSDSLDIAIVEPSEVHYYQPAFTLVGAGAYALKSTRKSEARLIPSGVRWIKDSVATFDPAGNIVTLAGGGQVSYDVLVVCPGLRLNWDGIKGLKDTVGRHGVCSNYSPDTVEYTWECLQGVKRGARMLFTQPPLPFKCPGAPQKIAYLAADFLKKSGIRQACDIKFLTHAPAIFGVPFYAKELVKIAGEHGIDVRYQHNLVEIDRANNKAVFDVIGGDQQSSRVVFEYDMLHVTPPQTTPDAVKTSPLANAAGFVDVHENSMQHVKFPNVFGLGDAASTPNSKTAAAVRKQAPVVVRNLLRLIDGAAVDNGYDGYAACPLTTSYSKVLMAEFIYGGKPTPTLPLDPAQERALNWWIKKTGLPMLYWDYMLKGFEAFPGHDTKFQPPA